MTDTHQSRNIRKEGLRTYLDRMAPQHDNHGYDDYVYYYLKGRGKNRSRTYRAGLFGVTYPVMHKYDIIYEEESKTNSENPPTP